jgi:isochorismate hydrolase
LQSSQILQLSRHLTLGPVSATTAAAVRLESQRAITLICNQMQGVRWGGARLCCPDSTGKMKRGLQTSFKQAKVPMMQSTLRAVDGEQPSQANRQIMERYWGEP